MSNKGDLANWIVEALRAKSRRASIVNICKHVWQHHEDDLRKSGDLFYTWQYDIRWAAQKLRDEGILRATTFQQSKAWELAD